MRLLVPGAEVDFLSVFGLPRRYRDLAEMRRALSPYDHVFSGAFTAPLVAARRRTRRFSVLQH